MTEFYIGSAAAFLVGFMLGMWLMFWALGRLK